jgi:hypothetical protein
MAPGASSPISLESITAFGNRAYVAVSSPGTNQVGLFVVSAGTKPAASWISVPKYVASISGSTREDGLWVGAVTKTGLGGALGLPGGHWSFLPAFGHLRTTAKLILASGGSHELWIGQLGASRLERLAIQAYFFGTEQNQMLSSAGAGWPRGPSGHPSTKGGPHTGVGELRHLSSHTTPLELQALETKRTG